MKWSGAPEQFEPAGLRVLLVLEPSSCGGIAGQLKACNYDVASSRGCSEALAALDGGKFDIVLCDLLLVSKQNIEQGKLLRLLKQTPFILMAENPTPAQVMLGIKLGAAEVLEKPCCQLKLKNIWQHTVRRMMHVKPRSERSGLHAGSSRTSMESSCSGGAADGSAAGTLTCGSKVRSHTHLGAADSMLRAASASMPVVSVGAVPTPSICETLLSGSSGAGSPSPFPACVPTWPSADASGEGGNTLMASPVFDVPSCLLAPHGLALPGKGHATSRSAAHATCLPTVPPHSPSSSSVLCPLNLASLAILEEDAASAATSELPPAPLHPSGPDPLCLDTWLTEVPPPSLSLDLGPRELGPKEVPPPSPIISVPTPANHMTGAAPRSDTTPLACVTPRAGIATATPVTPWTPFAHIIPASASQPASGPAPTGPAQAHALGSAPTSAASGGATPLPQLTPLETLLCTPVAPAPPSFNLPGWPAAPPGLPAGMVWGTPMNPAAVAPGIQPPVFPEPTFPVTSLYAMAPLGVGLPGMPPMPPMSLPGAFGAPPMPPGADATGGMGCTAARLGGFPGGMPLGLPFGLPMQPFTGGPLPSGHMPGMPLACPQMALAFHAGGGMQAGHAMCGPAPPGLVPPFAAGGMPSFPPPAMCLPPLPMHMLVESCQAGAPPGASPAAQQAAAPKGCTADTARAAGGPPGACANGTPAIAMSNSVRDLLALGLEDMDLLEMESGGACGTGHGVARGGMPPRCESHLMLPLLDELFHNTDADMDMDMPGSADCAALDLHSASMAMKPPAVGMLHGSLGSLHQLGLSDLLGCIP